MGYERSTAKVVGGLSVAYLGYYFATDTMVATVWLVVSAVAVAGFSLAVHGLFTGIEAAVATGTGRPDRDPGIER